MIKVINSERIPIKMWLDNIEEGALEQAKNLANLPFSFKHIAIMPDSHQGFGMPIGGVMGTLGVVIPNAVGVDIGCFTGDTKVSLLNGTQQTLKDLVDKGEDVWVYSLDSNLNIVPGKATPLKTRENAKLMEVVVSQGASIRCTPDHKFLLLNGEYKEAKDLKPFDSLMPLYRSYQSRDGYERVRAKNNGRLTHVLVAEYFLGSRPSDEYIIHHKNEKWYDNSPENLEYWDKNKHGRYHGSKSRRFATSDFKKKRLETLKENGFYSSEFAQKKKDIAIENIQDYMQNNHDEWLEKIKDNGKRGSQYLREFNEKNNKTLYSCGYCGREIYGKGGYKKHLKKCQEVNNHKVLYTKELDYTATVYCLNVEKYHNFALADGVFVHNCGMYAAKTSLTEIDVPTLKKIMSDIRKLIPLGKNHHKIEPPEADELICLPSTMHPVMIKNESKIGKQIGTLGGGNHFLEIQKGSDGNIWFMIHSGSRNLGKQVADYYNKEAIKLNEKWFSKVPKEWELAFLPTGEELFHCYWNEMNFALGFAASNRITMARRIIESFQNHVDCTVENIVHIHHNYAAWENHFGENVIVHRKGATRARDGEIGIIPGSQGTSSYIVKGKGNPESFMSCSHGAGRILGRKKAVRELNLQEELDKLDKQGIIHGMRTQDDLEEAVSCYKDISEVMGLQSDLTEILVELKPLAVIKG